MMIIDAKISHFLALFDIIHIQKRTLEINTIPLDSQNYWTPVNLVVFKYLVLG